MRAEVLSNIEVAPSYFHLTLSCPEFPSSFEPGQFVMLRLGKGFDPLLPRPFSIYRSSVLSPQSSGGNQKEVHVEILYKVIGKATGLMAGMGPGTKLELLGPLGKGFQVPAYLKTAILVAGGIGVPPIVALAEHLAISHQPSARKESSVFSPRSSGKGPRLLVFLGGKTKGDVLCIKDFEKLGAEVHIATEDGSLGFRGLVTEILKNSLPSAISHLPSAIYACGPHPMLAEVAAIASKHRIPCQVSLETMMACGLGACMGCAVRVRGQGSHQPSAISHKQYKLVCKDGPVFDARGIEW